MLPTEGELAAVFLEMNPILKGGTKMMKKLLFVMMTFLFLFPLAVPDLDRPPGVQRSHGGTHQLYASSIVCRADAISRRA